MCSINITSSPVVYLTSGDSNNFNIKPWFLPAIPSPSKSHFNYYTHKFVARLFGSKNARNCKQV